MNLRRTVDKTAALTTELRARQGPLLLVVRSPELHAHAPDDRTVEDGIVAGHRYELGEHGVPGIRARELGVKEHALWEWEPLEGGWVDEA